jgi:hypothetical protein
MTSEHKQQFEQTVSAIRKKMGYDLWKAQLWMMAKNPHMDDLSPSEAIIKGKFENLWKFIHEQIWEN